MKEFKIGIIYDKDNCITDLFHMNHITVYEKKETWVDTNMIRDIEIHENNLRVKMDTLIYKLDACKVIIGKEIVGIPYYILDKNGFIMCEADEFSQELLNQIEEDYFMIKQNSCDTEEVSIPKNPIALDNAGNYFLDFAKVQKYFPQISSKKALLPFFSHELFQSITIVCTHIMPWLETFVEQSNYHMEYCRDNGLYTIIITHKLCNQ